MRGDDSRNIDVPSKVKAFRADFPPDRAAVRTSYEFTEIAGAAAVIGHARVVLIPEEVLMSEASATRGLRAPKAGAQGMQDTRDTERAQTGAVGRALFLMGYGEKPDDSSEYEAEPDPDQWFRDNGWKDGQQQHDEGRAATFAVLKALPDTHRIEAVKEFKARSLADRAWTYAEAEDWAKYLGELRRKAKAETTKRPISLKDTQAGAGGVGDEAGEPASQPSLPTESIGPDAPFFKGSRSLPEGLATGGIVKPGTTRRIGEH